MTGLRPLGLPRTASWRAGLCTSWCRDRSNDTGAVEPSLSTSAGYIEWAVPPPLRRYVSCSWSAGSPRADEPVLPDGCMDIIWDGEQLFVSGPDTEPKTAPFERLTVGVRFRPGAGPLFLGVPADELCDRHVPLDALWSDAAAIADQLSACSTRREAAATLEDRTCRRVAGVGAPDPVVEAASRLWRHDATGANIAWLAEQAGVTNRQLHRRFVGAVGYGPKLLQRVLRFQAFLASCSSPTAGIADLAFSAGYADQSHLNREARALAERTPAELRARRVDVRNVQDACTPARYNVSMDQARGKIP